MYNSPIKLYETAMQTIMEEREGAIFAKIQSAFDVDVDKDELIRALQYDRGQYDHGYRDGKKDAMPKWIPVSERLPEKWGSAIVYRKGEQYSMLRYTPALGWHFYDSEWGDVTVDDVTHWMPLPEPPKEDA